MSTRAQIDVRQGNKVVRIYSRCDGYPRNILPALRAAASAGYSTPHRIASAFIREFGNGDDTVRIIDEDRSDYVSYRYVVDVASKPWHVRQTRMETVKNFLKADGSIDSNVDLDDPKNIVPAVTRSFRLGQ